MTEPHGGGPPLQEKVKRIKEMSNFALMHKHMAMRDFILAAYYLGDIPPDHSVPLDAMESSGNWILEDAYHTFRWHCTMAGMLRDHSTSQILQ